ncbi:NAD-P-binding protein [Stereum hirsutum FP-91666 SS1]|uniref:NAD-P-binding protein n=1 Tax=Stereum hirsutum (strain FP-91666) TaxID=721885 RepID=UPI000440AB4C|nr:NAD-P-binding protein [Stereum hirsutum FP-91666 SS1]EIM91153.1 NAD-P-binding protein [Stereum hirsutum FP-91666 SS1]
MSPTRVAIVTGAAQGIGRSIALRLAADGLNVAVNDVESQRQALDAVVSEIQAKGRKAVALTADVSSEEDVKNMVEKTVEHLGRLDVMVANAGIGGAGKGSSILTVDMEQWHKLMGVNVDGVVLCYKYAAIQMVKQGEGGRIIGVKGIAPYCASKFAVRGITQSVACELVEHNITVNAYAPGVVDTAIVKMGVQTLKNALNISNSRTVDKEAIASWVSYISSPEASFISGQTVIIDGGVQFD